MKVEEWTRLCKHEFNERYGDVCELRLTAESREELSRDIIGNGIGIFRCFQTENEREMTSKPMYDDVVAGATVDEIVNNETRSVVRVINAQGTAGDSYVVKLYVGGQPAWRKLEVPFNE